MCGIAGIVSFEGLVEQHSLQLMTDAIAHRGPDGEGFWINQSRNIALGHRRLAIIDIGAGGIQPMHAKNRYSITYNGEIYNYLELKEELISKGYTFKSLSDTEVILAMYDAYGAKCLEHFDGMFSLAIFDEQTNELFCARDRFGEKPFYYSHTKDGFHFASEMKALWAAGISKDENETLKYNNLAYGFMYNPKDFGETFFENIRQIPHAHYLILNTQSGDYSLHQWYELKQEKFEGTFDQAQDKISALLQTSITRRLRSDVEVGTSLSGGLDSSIVATLVQEKTDNLKTFSAIFPGYKKDESAYIRAVAGTIGAKSYTCTPTKKDWELERTEFINQQEEPIVDQSPYLLYKVYESAKSSGIKVLLDGQGADEVFAGYHAYLFTYLEQIEQSENFSSEKIAIGNLIEKGIVNDSDFFQKQKKLVKIFGEGLSSLRKWKQAVSQIRHKGIDQKLYKSEHKNSYSRKYNFESLQEHLYHDCFDGKLQTLLRYADRSSMAHGVEIRLPFLFHELVEFVLSLPAEFKINQGFTKWILRDLFKGKIPEIVSNRQDKIGAEGDF